jgi:hypothetical protein
VVANVDKDLLILVLKKEIDDLARLTQLQDKQIKNKDQSLDVQEQKNLILLEKMEILDQIIKAHEDMRTALEMQLLQKTDLNTELSRKLQEMQASIDNRVTE